MIAKKISIDEEDVENVFVTRETPELVEKIGNTSRQEGIILYLRLTRPHKFGIFASDDKAPIITQFDFETFRGYTIKECSQHWTHSTENTISGDDIFRTVF